jgi:hypothetical protein
MSLALPGRRSRSVYGQRFALDRASVRTIDVDGHLHVALNPISKANVCPYYGSEVPDAEQLGLDPNAVYQLYRDPEELRKAADSFDGKPLLLAHRPLSADDHSRQLTVGSVKNPVWKAPYLMAELDVWDSEAIHGIVSGDRRELSCGYRYKALMVPGEANGVRYDGRMTEIQGNHVSLVTEGRAGSDVMVGDSMPRHFTRSLKMKLRPDLDRIVADAKRKVFGRDAMPRAGMTRSIDMQKPLDAPDITVDDNNDDTEAMAKVLDFLEPIVSPDDLEIVQALLCGAADVEEAREQQALARRELDRQTPRQAADQARRETVDAEFMRMFPNANRLLLR